MEDMGNNGASGRGKHNLNLEDLVFLSLCKKLIYTYNIMYTIVGDIYIYIVFHRHYTLQHIQNSACMPSCLFSMVCDATASHSSKKAVKATSLVLE